MTHEEMSNFTNDELSCFTHYELSLDRMKLFYKILSDENNDIPEAILEKLHTVCTKTIFSIEKSSKGITIPQEIKDIISNPKPSRKGLNKVILFIIKLLVSSLVVSGIKSASVDNINFDLTKESVKTTYYISDGELNNDIDIVIEEIKTTTNINISLDQMEINWNSGE